MLHGIRLAKLQNFGGGWEWVSYSGGSLPLIFCIHVRLGPIHWEGLFTLQKRL